MIATNEPSLVATSAERRLAAIIVGVGTVLMLVVVTRGVPWHLFSLGDYTSNFYDEQARALLAGHLDVDPAVAAIEGFVVDGKTHFYFGPFLAVIRMPFIGLFGGLTGRLTALSIVIAYAVSLFGAFHLAIAVRSVVRRTTGHVQGDQLRIAALMLAVGSSPALFAGGWLTIYHETEIWALALGIVALAAAVRLLSEPRAASALVAAGAAAACVMTRVTVGLGVTLAVAVIVTIALRRRPRPAIATAGILAAGVAASAAFNYARFGTLFSLPMDLQRMTALTPVRAEWFAEHGGSFFSPEFIPTNLWAYLRPDAIAFERLLPIVRFGPRATEIGGADFESITPTTSLTVSATLLLILAAVGFVSACRARSWLWIVLAGALSAGGAASLAIGFVANRYLIDFLLPFVLLAAVGLASDVAPAWLTRRRALAALSVLTAWGLMVNVGLGLWAGLTRDPAFTSARYHVDAAAFPAPSPALVQLRNQADIDVPPRLGIVGIDTAGDAGCQGVYMSTFDEWTVLELGASRSLNGELDTNPSSDGTVLVAGRDGWRIDLQPSGQITLTLDGQEITLTTIDVGSGAPLRVELTLDPVSQFAGIQVGDEFIFLPPSLIDSTSTLDSGLDVDRTDELCRLLDERVDTP